MLNCEAFRMIFSIPNLPAKPVEVKPKFTEYAERSYKTRNKVMKALQDNKVICSREISDITGAGHSGIRYIVRKFKSDGLVKSWKVKADGKKPVEYYSLIKKLA